MRGPLHLSIGQEAVAAGVCAHLEREDLLTSTHRGHGHTLAKGGDMRRMMAELFGRADGSNGGKGGSMHIADFSVGMLGANGVVTAGLPIACGAAQALKLQGRPHLVACFFGDGAINRGPFLEALNWAAVYRLPVLFVCEDNRYSATTTTTSVHRRTRRGWRAPRRSACRANRWTATTSRPCTEAAGRLVGAGARRRGAAPAARADLARARPCVGGQAGLPRRRRT